jgi:hypothetical protein
LRLFVGDDWAETGHDVGLMDAVGHRLAKARLSEGVAGMSCLHTMIAEQMTESADEDVEVVIGFETDRGGSRWRRARRAAARGRPRPARLCCPEAFPLGRRTHPER